MPYDDSSGCGRGVILPGASSEVGITGVVSPWEWGEFHNLVGISIRARDGTNYVVLPGGMGRMLFNHVDRQVEAVGQVKRMKDAFCIQVRHFSLCESGK